MDDQKNIVVPSAGVSTCLLPNAAKVHLTSFARLHMGFFDLHGGLGRKFGSIGVSLAEPSLSMTGALLRESNKNICVNAAATVPQLVTDKALALVEYLMHQLQLSGGLSLTIHQHIPTHAGLGSGTQMALSIGTVISQLYDLGLSTAQIAILTGRGGRSGIGVAAFDVGGVLIDGGRTLHAQSSEQTVPPLLARYDWPEDWRILLIFDAHGVGVHGADEKAAFKSLPEFSASVAADLCRHVLMQMMPALVERDLSAFGQAIQALQLATGDYFAPVQGGRYASKKVAAALAYLQTAGIACFGQSSWGPTGFAVFERSEEAQRALQDLENTFKNNGLTYLITSACNVGARLS